MEIQEAFQKVISETSFPEEEQSRLLQALEKINRQEQLLLLQLFAQFPDKILPFWEMTKKKFEYIKTGQGNIQEVLKEEIENFT